MSPFQLSQTPIPLQLNEEQKGWEVGQLVQWDGVAGKVVSTHKGKLRVKFINHMVRDFLTDGRYEEWHIDSALKSCSEQELQRQAYEYSQSRKN